MATLRQSITTRIEGLTAQIAKIKDNAAAAIEPLQADIQTEEQKLVSFAPWLEQEVDVAQTKLNTLLGSYKVNPQ